MSATRAIFFGVALGFAAGATAAFAQDTDMSAGETLGIKAGTDTEMNAEPGPSLEANTAAETEGNVGDTAAGAEAGTAVASDAATATSDPSGTGDISQLASMTDLVGARVYGPNEEWVGEVSEVLPEPAAGEPRVVISVGGFLGFGETPVEVVASDISIEWTAEGDVQYAQVDMTEDELMAMAEG